MMIDVYDIITHKPRKTEVCNWCYRPDQVLHDTLKIGITKSFGTLACEDCLLFRWRLNHPTRDQEDIRKEREHIMRIVNDRRQQRQRQK